MEKMHKAVQYYSHCSIDTAVLSLSLSFHLQSYLKQLDFTHLANSKEVGVSLLNEFEVVVFELSRTGMIGS